MKFQFVKNKYGREILIDCERMSDVKTFTMDETPFCVDFHELFLITEGKGSFKLDNETIRFSRGTLLLLPPNKWRQWTNVKAKVDGYFLIFEEDFISQFFNDHLFLYRFHYFYNNYSPSYINLDEFQLVEHIKNLEKIRFELRALKQDSGHYLRSILYYLLIYTNRLYSGQHNIIQQFFEDNLTLRFRKLLEREIRIHHNVAYYANSLKVSRSHLNKTLQHSIGKSTSAIIKLRLFAEAKKKLTYSKKTISEMAYDLNFSEASNFNRFFKDMSGFTPKKFRLMNLK